MRNKENKESLSVRFNTLTTCFISVPCLQYYISF